MKANISLNRITKVLLSGLGIAGLLLSHNASAVDARLGHVFTDQHPRGLAMQRFAAEVEKGTGGKIIVKLFGSSSLGAEDKMLQAVQSGVQEFYLGSLAPISSRKKELQVFDFPFLFTNDSEAAQVLDGPVGRKMLEDMGDTGALGLVWSGGAFRNVSNSKHAINKFEDLKGLKIRVMQTPVAIDSFKAMGTNPTPMAFSEVYTALEIKAIDGFENPAVDMYQNKIFEVQKYLAITNHVYTPIALMVSKKWFSALPTDQQSAIKKAAEIARDFERAEEIRQAKGAVKLLKESGMVVTELAAPELEKIRVAVRPVIEKYSASIGPEFVKSFFAEVDAARKAK